ncbi:hypothetical protein Saso_02180 [Streptomyces asoensis]|uniref:Uncharacterized protein n=1 Tax=Streptomyces asoensis TaxID=249586 RepID=A0ABQ3RRT3_9ACTN|nr:hypothetical protein GCM10010496_03110 [Streptomyces asoensis]GHI58568.1 hypothetical protein Saso_02180 [Streptomyces asoensis]
MSAVPREPGRRVAAGGGVLRSWAVSDMGKPFERVGTGGFRACGMTGVAGAGPWRGRLADP